MRITVVGAGPVGSTLAGAWLEAGHELTVVVRDPTHERHEELSERVPVVSPAEGLPNAEMTLIAIPGTALPDLIHRHASILNGQLIIDATNRMGRVAFHQLPLYQSFTPRARVYRAFCCYGWDVFANPVINGVPVDLPFCGAAESPGDLGSVEKLISDVGLNPLWLGGLEAAETLDGVLRLWYALAVDRGMGRRTAFRTLSG